MSWWCVSLGAGSRGLLKLSQLVEVGRLVVVGSGVGGRVVLGDVLIKE